VKLLVTPKPEKGESFIGYLVRLTELNGYDTPSWILSLADIDYMELQWTFSFAFGKTKGLKKLADLSNNTLEYLNTLVYFPANFPQGNTTEHDFDFYGATLNRSIIRPHHPKICPKCLADFGYCLRLWDCSLVTACPIHRCLLLDRCPKCRRQIRAIRKSVSMCHCGCDWREIDSTGVNEKEMAVSRRVFELCESIPNEQPCNSLNELNLRDFIVAISFIAGRDRKISWATGRPSKSIKMSNRELHKLYNVAYSVFDDWPDSFFRFLKGQSKRCAKIQPNDGKLDTALKREFGSLYESLYQDLEGLQFDFLREAFCEFLTDRMQSQSATPVKMFLKSGSSESETYASLVDARRRLKITNAALFDLIAAGEIRCTIVNRRRTPEFAVSFVDVERIKCDFEDSVTCRELAKELGTDCDTIRELADNELIMPLVRRSTDAFSTLRFRRRHCREFLNLMWSLTKPKAYFGTTDQASK
jgi:TniQ